MKRNRYLLCLLASFFLLYYAVPRLSVTAEGPQGVFALAWLVLALFVIAGNLTGLLYHPKRPAKAGRPQSERFRKKTRSYMR
ncbi:hypothetical protein ACQYAD_15240 [Neobacillus sp. SM06]|uniref:hypothetical protein n=1 Tax=Neobacillus sp. SM06 TaxID=3422492 RepID=UPI003D2929A4